MPTERSHAAGIRERTAVLQTPRIGVGLGPNTADGERLERHPVSWALYIRVKERCRYRPEIGNRRNSTTPLYLPLVVIQHGVLPRGAGCGDYTRHESLTS